MYKQDDMTLANVIDCYKSLFGVELDYRMMPELLDDSKRLTSMRMGLNGAKYRYSLFVYCHVPHVLVVRDRIGKLIRRYCIDKCGNCYKKIECN